MKHFYFDRFRGRFLIREYGNCDRLAIAETARDAQRIVDALNQQHEQNIATKDPLPTAEEFSNC